MSETMFAQALMSGLEKRPSRLSSDHVSDPRKYPAQAPYTLPKPVHPFPRRQRPSAGQQSQSVNVSLKPLKGSDNLDLPNQSINTTVLDLKAQYADKFSLDKTKIKVLLNKRPCADLKTLKDILADPLPAKADFSIMLLAGASTPSQASTPVPASPVVKPEESQKLPPDSAPLSEHAQAEAEALPHAHDNAAQMLKSDEFWADLKDFLVQRLRDESQGERLTRLFRQASA
ncbi:hypothetical protein AUEXF2481DRAFT_656600 [Aureobasidium subglaciale EXF-2481]|uniref:Ubiquitin-like domain-containing protein n=1 Tax=Aureobasidium subglaciale (strain EXF-2481) TaxID=1043005 RepID=A0A074YPJ6_AURSE|nr:uncharacterized protein AUEXF2481DRAFT_656600 [Aureobasidium subglaciale EXF-2481]KAI5211056.1 hypothetical protein E4T38_01617 [Aureobasidium subglaciale]KAI5219053.1 hypothetical protein E4T40_06532 [Aureobasidium subglaciale]KAI5233156.1 hypothetical protein E4T41_01615 [Aureobasidium subglaciale]KAI5260062.1 hypothetical protein E4T46_06332 [Aureobasidium subglaciale]KEQ96002.1 hypothetical protein AUEXF2481DRAFT_656600 [Aureobasidium subglaciale EXF-2481]